MKASTTPDQRHKHPARRNNSEFVNILISSTNNIIPRAGHTPHSRISAKYWSCVMSHLSRFGDEKFIIKVTRWRESSLRVSPTRHFHQKVLFWYQNYLEKCPLYSPWLFFSSLPSDSRISSSRWQRAVALNNIIVETYSLSKLIQDYQRSPHHVLQTPHSFIITVCTSGSWARVCALKQLPVPERTCRASSWTRSSSCVSSLLTRGSASETRMNSEFSFCVEIQYPALDLPEPGHSFIHWPLLSHPQSSSVNEWSYKASQLLKRLMFTC